MATERLGLADLSSAQADAYVRYNENIRQLEAMHGGVENIQNTPAGSPSDGAVYIVGTAPTGAWAGQANNLAHWYNASWHFYVPVLNQRHWRNSNDTEVRFDGSGWV